MGDCGSFHCRWDKLPYYTGTWGAKGGIEEDDTKPSAYYDPQLKKYVVSVRRGCTEGREERGGRSEERGGGERGARREEEEVGRISKERGERAGEDN